MSETDDSWLGDFFGRPSWPVTAIVAALIALWGVWMWQDQELRQRDHQAENDLKVQIVAECADHENVKRCADEMREALD